ncbi:2,3-bisphosphoglycerate-independent phosphoglycerate mutase [Patescibacteria group bacterium]|nr:2,3-bisphosphoglycerate-independent phosphoglycerate mutase [Patescibacteria group bacterium]
MRSEKKTKFVLLAVIDGWGMAPNSPGNAISLAKTPNMDRFMLSYPHGQLVASGEAVGLPRGESGNTETGHLNLGAGRLVFQDLLRINMSIADGSFYENTVFLDAIEHARKNNSYLHLIGLIGAAGVHSNIEHLFALLQLAKRQSLDRVLLHLITDGRDSPPNSAMTYIKQVQEVIKKYGVGKIASIMGRYWAMDRDFRWERTARAYFTLIKGSGPCQRTPEDVIETSYKQGKSDEFIEPCTLTDENGTPIGSIKDNDSIIFTNFRIDRPRQLSIAFIMKNLNQETAIWGFDTYKSNHHDIGSLSNEDEVKIKKQAFDRGVLLKNLNFAIMTNYGKPLIDAGAKIAFPREAINQTLGQTISEAGLRQLRISESEKERFVTFYFNGQREQAFTGEDRIIVPSPKVPTYDQKPEMASRELTDALLNRIKNPDDYSFILVNFAAPDVVGHTGNIGAAVAACEVVDECLGKITNFVTTYNGVVIITSDHGNVEEMINSKTGAVDTNHSLNPVPFIAISKNYLSYNMSLQQGILADVAPTILTLLGLPKPAAMTGHNLLEGVWKR